MGIEFRKAVKEQARLRAALIGPSGSGKTYTALRIATSLGKRVALIDTERGSASKYADEFDFDVLELDTFAPQKYCEAIQAAGAAGYDVLVVDSLSHAWSGTGGALEQVENVKRRTQSSSSFSAWRQVTPLHNRMVDTILQSTCHVIVTMRAKTEFVQEKDDRGKTVIRKVGLAPVQRDGLEYEFDVVADMDMEHNLIISKTRCPQLTDQVFNKAGSDVGEVLTSWLTSGAPKAAQTNTEQDVDESAPPYDTTSVVDSFGDLIRVCRSQTDLDLLAKDIAKSVADPDDRRALKLMWSSRREELRNSDA